MRGTADFRCFLGAPWRVDFDAAAPGEIDDHVIFWLRGDALVALPFAPQRGRALTDLRRSSVPLAQINRHAVLEERALPAADLDPGALPEVHGQAAALGSAGLAEGDEPTCRRIHDKKVS